MNHLHGVPLAFYVHVEHESRPKTCQLLQDLILGHAEQENTSVFSSPDICVNELVQCNDINSRTEDDMIFTLLGLLGLYYFINVLEFCYKPIKNL